ncbi:hypothetical protein [Vibrio parahaemolyticus]|uniref:hypothetical protein n=1 Tax=Vibrio parahaemolyticus TaxID=670 RepID=UPI00193E13C7|nr:hypothetical protein [Vibrio parahaemolyticus]EHK4786510.1 hypothetical protein [Vibrio parahaemolyticus]EIJ0976116.1 hypothetical protein [Vibrio parahaemolyticus]MBM4991963.1 hypothetical protein [Vibrio parahaemolyticus]MBM4996517.1 hypothetical protein [Vibrio parahaemolyticus]MCG6485333.1 hypothetical protein [Vibrio parahaemolyticus]
MTMIVGLHLGDYVLVAADKRETYVVNGQVVSVISDEVNKLVNWGAGVLLVVDTCHFSMNSNLN